MFLIVNNAEKGIGEFCEPLEKILKDAGIDSKTIEYEDTLETEISEYEGVFLSGSPRGNDIADSRQPYFQWIKTAAKPVFGICAGHHIVGRLYGAELLRSLEKEVGDFFVEIDNRDPVFQGFPDRFMVRQNHFDSITLPEDFVLLAHSGTCKVEAIKHRRLPIYTTQFHPEFLNPRMLLNFVTIVRSRE
ncbi:MAG: gamma-glutamyl-gamma-aminobutyrate hydrolase family protein [Candidatus Aminicenantes bacterium]|nr:gamma-glutamyl-gamma-aminobutyrate hydrolase family protein [Candidatus Aminicenantes bacterium]